jgi:hypothetical protein
MAYKKFSDYISEQKIQAGLPGKTDKPIVKTGKFIKPADYYAPGAKKDHGLMTADDNRGIPLGEKGSPGMTPKVAQPLGTKPAGAPKSIKHGKNKASKKMKNEVFLNKTAKLSDSDFTKMMLESNSVPKPKIHDLQGNKYTPEPAETVRYVVNLMLKNETYMGRVVRELKRAGGLTQLVNEIFTHPETYQIIAEAASTNARINRKLTEAVAEPRGMSGSGGSPAGPNGATAGRMPRVNVGGGGGGMPPTPPSESEETPEGDDSNMDLLDDSEGDEEKNDDLEGNEDSENGDENNDDEDHEDHEDDEDWDDKKGKHTHIHVHNHHHHGDEMGGDKLKL